MTKPRADSAGPVRPPKDREDVVAGSMLDYALRYADLGWHVFPVHSVRDGCCTCGDPDCARPGKHPIRELVRDGLKSATTNPQKIAAWWAEANAPWANVAVATGPKSGIWVLDIDTRIEKQGEDSLETLTRKHGPLPDTAEAITGGGGRHLVFAWPEGHMIGNATNRLGPGLDVRGDGGYIVVEPSMHISGHPYYWEASGEPFASDATHAAPEWLVHLVASGSSPETPPPLAGGGRALSPTEKLEIRSALAYLDADDYHTWIQVGMALQASQAAEAFALWTEWSQLSAKYDPKAMQPKWASFRDRPGGVGLSTIFGMAQKAGWVNPSSRVATDFEELMQRASRTPRVVEEPAAPRAALPVPILEDAARWISEAFPLTHPVATDQAVLALASLGASRIYTSPMGDPAHVYLGIAGKSVGELRYLRTALHKALDDAGLRKLIRGTRFTSPQTVYQTLLRAPASLYATEEWGQMVAFAKRQPSGLVEQALNVIADAYEARAIYLDSAADAGIKTNPGDDQPTIQSPALTLLALMSMDQLEAVGRQGEWGRGSLEQMLTAIVPDESGEHHRPLGELKCPEWLTLHLCAVRRVDAPGGNLAGVVTANGQLAPDTIEVDWGTSSRAHEEFLIEAIGQQDRRLLPLAHGGVKTMRRLAVALAAWADPQRPIVTREMLDWLGAYVHRHLTVFADRLNLVGSDEGRTSVYQKVVQAVVDAGTRGLSMRDLTRYVWGFRNMNGERREELITLLVEDRQIHELPSADNRRRVLVADRFVHFGDEKPTT